MQRRGGSGQPAKGQSANRPEARETSTAQVATADLREQVAALTRELKEAREQQTATSEVLRVISNSPGQLGPVFQAMLEHATRVCDAKFGVLFRYEDGLFHPATLLDVPPAFSDFLDKQGAFAPKPGQLFGRLCQSKTVIAVVDRATDPDPSPSVRYGGARSSIAVPMLKENELVGAFSSIAGSAALYRQADRAGEELRRAGRHCHREHAAAQRAARIAPAADRHRRRAQGHQPFDLRPADGARHAGAVGRQPLRGGSGRDPAARWAIAIRLPQPAVLRSSSASTWSDTLHKPGRGSVFGRTIVEGRTVHIPDVTDRPGMGARGSTAGDRHSRRCRRAATARGRDRRYSCCYTYGAAGI